VADRDKHSTPESKADARKRAAQIVEMAWKEIPADHRGLLEEVGASQWTVLADLLGAPVHKLLRSAGGAGLSEEAQNRADAAIAVWVPDLRVVAFTAGHPALVGLNDQAFEQVLARTAWHEWGHALSIARCTAEDVSDGERLLDLAPTSVSDTIRGGNYFTREYTQELIADIYAILIERRRARTSGRPIWLHEEIYNLVKRTTGWAE
jgi:hypothetical protein